MANINSLSGNQYYQLAAQQNNTNQSASAQGAGSDALIQQLVSQSGSSSDGDIVDFSQAAKDYLSNLNLSAGSEDPQSGNFILTNAQQEKLKAILAKYKDAPFTQDTYNKLQDDLKAAGLSPEQLSTQDKVNSFNATKVLLDIISGNQTEVSNPATASDDTQKTKSDDYMQQILSQLKAISSGNSANGVSA